MHPCKHNVNIEFAGTTKEMDVLQSKWNGIFRGGENIFTGMQKEVKCQNDHVTQGLMKRGMLLIYHGSHKLEHGNWYQFDSCGGWVCLLVAC